MDTYDSILERMTAAYSEYAGFVPPKESDIMLRLRVLAGEVYRLEAEAEYMKRQMFPVTAEGEYLDRHAAERGITRRPAAYASGQVLFFPENEEHDEILVPAGTEVCTFDSLSRYVTLSDAVITPSHDRVLADVVALTPGAVSNALGGNVTVIVTPVLGVGRVYNPFVFTGGADEESDDELRQRIIDSFVNVDNGANAAYYRNIALSVQGVYSASVIGKARGAGTVDVYISGRGNSAPASVKSAVQTLMNERRELNTNVLVRDPEAVYVSVDIEIEIEPGYDFAAVAQEVRAAVADRIDGLGVGADVKISDIGEVVYHIKGVADYHFVNNTGSDTAIAYNKYPTADLVTVSEA